MQRTGTCTRQGVGVKLDLLIDEVWTSRLPGDPNPRLSVSVPGVQKWPRCDIRMLHAGVSLDRRFGHKRDIVSLDHLVVYW